MAIENENWVKTQERNMLFRNGKKGELPQRLLEYSDTNRIVSPEQGQDGTVLNLIRDHLRDYDLETVTDSKGNLLKVSGWDFVTEVIDHAEKYTLTTGKLENSRTAFQTMYKAWIAELQAKSKMMPMGL